MVTALFVGEILLFILVFLLAGACTELLRDVRQLQGAVGILDTPHPLELAAAGERPSTHGLPDRLDRVDFEVLLIVSDRCASCRSLLGAIKKPLPESLSLLVEARDEDRAIAWLSAYSLELGDRVLFDEHEEAASSLGLRVSPAAVVIVSGRFASATTVPSARRLRALLEHEAQSSNAGEVPVPRKRSLPRDVVTAPMVGKASGP